ncbi:hypothetical protein IE53DRAFT_362807 [Violaceomyces palustris]|uniref:Uncharacterized protein n=1 Tax=Violaceomyces palustris TaxID=1673888 RepID=A0ACD0NVL8_9BASI|nr:hypothetical protein IE53DRAFT_362807 [Violaceomyces palustris]
MDPPLAPPLRLKLEHPDVPISHPDTSDMIRLFLAEHAARTGAAAAAGPSNDTGGDSNENGGSASTSTGGVMASQLTRLMNGLDQQPLAKVPAKEEADEPL